MVLTLDPIPIDRFVLYSQWETLPSPLFLCVYRYTLFLPAGAQYSPHSGAVSDDAGVQLAGLRRFRLPLRADFQMLKSAKDRMWDAVR